MNQKMKLSILHVTISSLFVILALATFGVLDDSSLAFREGDAMALMGMIVGGIVVGGGRSFYFSTFSLDRIDFSSSLAVRGQIIPCYVLSAVAMSAFDLCVLVLSAFLLFSLMSMHATLAIIVTSVVFLGSYLVDYQILKRITSLGQHEISSD